MNRMTWAALLATMVCMVSGTTVAQSEDLPLFVVHFETGPGWDASRTPTEQSKFREHSANMSRLRDQGVILFGARYAEYGMIVIQTASLEEAQAILQNDPGVQAETFTYRVSPMQVFYPWQNPETPAPTTR